MNDDINQTLPTIDDWPRHNISKINVTASSVYDFLSILNTSKATGPDNLNAKILKNTAKSISKPLAKIFNYSLYSHTFPSCWKKAHVSPIHKKGDQHIVNNYRPISLLCILSKVFERIVYRDVYNFLLKHDKLNKYQAAYREGSSTEFQLLEIYDSILKAVDSGKLTRYVFLDCSKAFDRVWHRGLIHKLKKLGITGILLKWFTSYLEDRSQCVVINGKVSEQRKLEAGVPQGSILGPLLFLIYVNDINDVVTTSQLRLYADDCSLFCSGKNINEINRNLNEALEKISQWAKDWKITFNAQKTESITFSTRKPRHIEPLVMNNTQIMEVNEHKHLGCILQNNCKWRRQLDNLTINCARKVDILRSLKHTLSRKTLEHLYKAFIRPKLEYASCVWGNASLEQLRDVENVQLASMRAITGAIKGTSHELIYRELPWETTYERRTNKNLMVYYKIFHTLSPSYLSDILPPKVHLRTTYNLRNKNDIQNTNAKTSLYLNSFIPKISKQWNNLHDEVKYIGSLHDFKKHLEKNVTQPSRRHYLGNRQYQLVTSRMRMHCSALNSHLHKMHIIESPLCSCGQDNEDPEHYFFSCDNYQNIRHILNNLDNRIMLSVDTILHGDNKLSRRHNDLLIDSVAEYIKESKRF